MRNHEGNLYRKQNPELQTENSSREYLIINTDPIFRMEEGK